MDCATSSIEAPENTRDGSDVPPSALALRSKATRPHIERVFTGEKRGSAASSRRTALAQDAGMTLPAVRGLPLRRGAGRLGGARASRCGGSPTASTPASEVRIVGDGTDLRFSLAGRHGLRRRARREHARRRGLLQPGRGLGRGRRSRFSEYPACYPGHQVDGRPAPLRGRHDRRGERRAPTRSSCSAMLDADEGARRLGEFGIGCNPGIQRHMRNTLFDEKIEGTIHLAIGHGLPVHRRHERERRPLGHGQGPAARRAHRARRRGRPGERAWLI